MPRTHRYDFGRCGRYHIEWRPVRRPWILRSCRQVEGWLPPEARLRLRTQPGMYFQLTSLSQVVIATESARAEDNFAPPHMCIDLRLRDFEDLVNVGLEAFLDLGPRYQWLTVLQRTIEAQHNPG